MPQYPADIPNAPKVSPPFASLVPLCQAPLAAWGKEQAVLLCCVITATLLLATCPASPQHHHLPLQEGVWVGLYT